MFIISKDGTHIFNCDNIVDIFVSNKDNTIRANLTNNRSCEIDEYDTREDAMAAIKIITPLLGVYSAAKMPDEKELQAKRVANGDTRERASNGKKPTRRGGS